VRISRNQMLMLWAHISAARGTCNRLKVGAVIAMESRPISAGYNGAPSGMPHCDSSCNEDNPCLNTDHAEDNAIKWARAFGIDPRGSTLYVTHSPCNLCADKIIQAGIARVVYDNEYRDNRPLGKLMMADVEVDQCRINPVIIAILQNLLIILASKE